MNSQNCAYILTVYSSVNLSKRRHFYKFYEIKNSKILHKLSKSCLYILTYKGVSHPLIYQTTSF